MQNSLEQIKLLNLTEEDFQLLVGGLDALPDRDAAGEMMGDLLGAMLVDKDEEKKNKWMAERDSRRLNAERSKQVMKENIKILQ